MELIGEFEFGKKQEKNCETLVGSGEECRHFQGYLGVSIKEELFPCSRLGEESLSAFLPCQMPVGPKGAPQEQAGASLCSLGREVRRFYLPEGQKLSV